MRFLMFRHGSGRRLGVLAEGRSDTVIDLAQLALATTSAPPPPDLLALIDAGDPGLDAVRRLLVRLKPGAASPITHPLAGVEVLAPLDPPRGNVVAIGLNYAKHVSEATRQPVTGEQPPTVFTKAITTIAGPYEDIPIDPAVSEQIDWEVELGVVIGRGGYSIPREDALDHVFGYTVINDVSARDIQSGWGGQFFKGKSLDSACPSGPWVVTRDEIPDPQSLPLRLTVNGTVKQDSNTRDMIHPVDSIIKWISLGMTLLPGTLIATGTPEGVGFARTPPEFIHPGDLVEAEVGGIGTLRNRFVEAKSRRAP
jgi:2-keto-4-pentenoate hydratase/2-oxohepta-3-ene-1,7-dioic acid hydratase in catechol pathway